MPFPSRTALAAAAAALILAGCGPDRPEFTGPAGTPQQAPQAEAPATDALSAQADPAWVERVASDAEIPARAVAAYAGADLRVRAEEGCSVGWNTLAGIGRIESRHGAIFGGRIGDDGRATSDIIGIPLDGTNETLAIEDTDGGVLDGDTEWDRAVGPMQFIPETWQRWGAAADGDGPGDPQNIDDAALAAARYLCSVGESGLDDEQDWIAAVRTYNDSRDYQFDVAAASQEYGHHG
ncbi:hypothetical protein BHE97_02570 [Aeromicrobium sp. PE09-221]|uniref:lytic murein transglycosylase n=1 Tax=Aeromicrobium sp. PE09-221 TaxID=1898043 RepID=UPI000B3E47C9|nr:lytic murein transglycosylase [Aeromicrobium sp. PE09-221]OUZ12303.1 hypothetical protein BHE97_02570 [Aeromicrobium sp. PE09-221]